MYKKILVFLILMLYLISCISDNENNKNILKITTDKKNTQNNESIETQHEIKKGIHLLTIDDLLFSIDTLPADTFIGVGNDITDDVYKPLKFVPGGLFIINSNIQEHFNALYRIPNREPNCEIYSSYDDSIEAIVTNEKTKEIDIIFLSGKNVTTRRGIKNNDSIILVEKEYGKPGRIITGEDEKIYEYKNMINHDLFKEIVLAFKVNEEKVNTIIGYGIFRDKYVITADDFSLELISDGSTLNLGNTYNDNLDIDFEVDIESGSSDENEDKFYLNSEDINIMYRRNNSEIQLIETTSRLFETKRGLKAGDTVDRLYELYGNYFDINKGDVVGFSYQYSAEFGSPFCFIDSLLFYHNNGVIVKIVISKEPVDIF